MKDSSPAFLDPRARLILSVVLAASPLCAQNPIEPEEGGVLPETVVVSEESRFPYQVESSRGALFTETPLIETPFSIGVYNEELIEDQRAFTLKEVLQNDPSVAVQMPGGFYNNQNLGLRGFRVDNFVGYRVDGLPITQVVAPYLDDKSRVEVLKGPAALRYGFMPPGGAINLVRKRPTENFSTSLQFDIDTFGSAYSQLDVSDTVADGQFGYRLVLAGDDFDSYYDNAGGDRFMGSLFTEWNPTDKIKFWGSISGQDRTRHGYYGPLISGSGVVFDTGVKTNTMQDWARNEQETFDLAAGADIDFHENWSARTSFSYQDMKRSSAVSYADNIQDNGDYEDYAFLLGDNLQQWETWSNHSQIEGRFDTGPLSHEVVVGGQYRSLETKFGDRVRSLLGPSNAYDRVDYPRPADPTNSWDAYDYEEVGFFLTDTIELNEYFSTLLGVRYGKIDVAEYFQGDLDYEFDSSSWSPTAALMFEPVENVHTYLTYTQGIQDGGLTPFRGVANPYEPLGVQDSEQWELGAKAKWFEGRLAGEVALFQIEQDLALTDPETNIQALNGLQRHRGVELALRGQITEELQAGIATTILDAEQVDTGSDATDGKRPQHVPNYQVNLWGVLEIPQIPGLALTANARFVDKQYLDQGEQFATDRYSVLDLGARYQFQTDHADWTVRLNVENVLDERYYETGEFYPRTPNYVGSGYLAYGQPVSANLSVQIDF